MSQRQEALTDRLVSIIQNIQLGRGSGLLTARRGEGITSEEGTIVFVNGQVTEAKVGRRTGPEALNTLSTWGSCSFTFIAPDNGPSRFFPASAANGQTESQPVTQPQVPLNPPTPPFLAISPLRKQPFGTLHMDGSERSRLELPTTPAPISAVPYYTRQVEIALRIIENMGLSRAHRQLFLLIDGQRSIADLVRLTGRNHADIYGFLRDLERATVIRVPE